LGGWGRRYICSVFNPPSFLLNSPRRDIRLKDPLYPAGQFLADAVRGFPLGQTLASKCLGLHREVIEGLEGARIVFEDCPAPTKAAPLSPPEAPAATRPGPGPLLCPGTGPAPGPRSGPPCHPVEPGPPVPRGASPSSRPQGETQRLGLLPPWSILSVRKFFDFSKHSYLFSR